MNTENKLTMIPIDRLFPHPDNPRKDVGDVTELAESGNKLADKIKSHINVVTIDGAELQRRMRGETE